MKKTIFSTFLFILFLLFIFTFYLSFFGYETAKFNNLIKSEIEKSEKNVSLEFEKISILLDIKKFTLFVKFINPKLYYFEVPVPLKSLRTDINLKSATEKKVGIKKIILSTDYLSFKEIKPLAKKIWPKTKNLENIKSAKFMVQNLKLEFDKNLKLKNNFKISGKVDSANIKFTKEYEINNLIMNYSYEKNNLNLNNISWNFNDVSKKDREFFDGELNLKQTENSLINLSFKTREAKSFLKIPILNYSFSKSDITSCESKFLIKKNKTIFLKNILIKDTNNEFEIKNLSLSKDYNLIDFKEIKVKTILDGNVNNEFKIINQKKQINIDGKIFDAKILMKELNQDTKKDKFFKKFSKDIEVEFDRILKGAKFPIKNFRLVGRIDKGIFEKIQAKSDFPNNKHLDILLKKEKETNVKILEVVSDIATPLLSDFKFFRGLEGGNLIYISKFDKKESSSVLTVNNFKLNDAPALAKLLTLADLKGLTDTLKGEGISFDTLSVKYKTNPSTMTINEIFMIGPSISILIDGYVEKKNGLVSLRGTLVPAKQLNKIVSKIPVVGEILVGKKIGEGVFGLSFKIKGLPNELKTTVNPIKTLAPRFITRAIEAAKKKKTK